MDLKKTMLDKKVWAVIGATPDTSKFGYKIYKRLKNHGYTVYGVNPNYTEVEGEKIYRSIAELPEKPECIDMVVSPRISEKFLDEIKENGIEYVWFQPGTFDTAVIEKAESLNLKIVYKNYACVLVELG
ncbi:CoA-binding protein [Serpentinicella alkaliphila]|uniref:CoA-binding domain-containing protein n=1 Tax=Serpentinicella alkaliphila TaxID=1734049 RepID=A0A4R2TQG0_9FIRM|nr:CoA-binding protein [Serpentinicella alkaliphila]QUH26025.1 CoA-binding protein [Serpentinicella alkaliphila]TCP99718.1 hypothetical protein EDD79_10346 [Serpentinicella alkaliphila]